MMILGGIWRWREAGKEREKRGVVRLCACVDAEEGEGFVIHC